MMPVRWRTTLLMACVACGTSTACARATVEMYVTTPDRARLLSRAPDLRFEAAHPAGASVTADSAVIHPDSAVIHVNPRQRFQPIVGFGAALTDASAWLIQHRLSPAQRDSLLTTLFGPPPGAAFSFVRVDMGASDFSLRHYSYADTPAGRNDPGLAYFSIAPDTAETLPLLKRALLLNPQLTLMASPWSAPAWMKTTGSMIGGTLRPDAYDAYAEYFRRFVQAYAAEGVPVHLVSVVNEPHHEPSDYPGMRMTPAMRAAFIGRHLGPLFARAGITTRILEWDHNWDEPQSPLAVLADSAARRYVAGVAWHCYAGDVAAQSLVRDSFPDKDTYFTECSGGAWAPNFGDNLAWNVRHLIIGATRHWARGVLLWNLALDDAHGPHLGGCGDCRGVVTIGAGGRVTLNEEYYALAHASRFVRPGAHRVASTTSAAELEQVAFRNPDGSIALVLLNTAASARVVRVVVDGRSFRTTLPAGAVVTYRWGGRA